MKTKRIQKILQLLSQNPQGISGAEIATRLNVSSRTVRSDIKNMQEILTAYESKIFSSPTRGYRLLLNETYDELEAALQGQTAVEFGIEDKRREYIMRRLLEYCLNNAAITQMDLADEMFIGLTTLKNYLSDVKQQMLEYGLQIVPYKTQGIRLDGDESSLRYCMVDFIERLNDKELSVGIFDGIKPEEINNLLRRILSIRNLQLTDISQKNLCIHTALIIKRTKTGNHFNCSMRLAKKLEESFEYSVAKDIVEEILKYTGLDVAYSEVYYLAQCLLTSKKLITVDESVNKEHIEKLVYKIINQIKEQLTLDFTADKYLLDGLSLHLSTVFARMQFHMNIRNELLESIKKDYPLAFQMGVIAAKVVHENDGFELNENEIGFIALHFGAAISRNSISEKETPKNVIIVCSAGLGVSVLLKAKVEEHFCNRIRVISVVPSYEIDKAALEQVDYIFSTVPLDNIHSSKIIRINHMLRIEDIERIERTVFNKSVVNAQHIEKFFSEDNFYINLNFKTKEECIDFLTDKAVSKGLMSKESKQSVFERERMSSTAIGDLAAIPHPMLDNSIKSSISILVLEKPVMWDDMPVMVVFLLNIEYAQSAIWETAFLKLYEYIKNKGGVSSMLQHKSYEIFLKEYLSMF